MNKKQFEYKMMNDSNFEENKKVRSFISMLRSPFYFRIGLSVLLDHKCCLSMFAFLVIGLRPSNAFNEFGIISSVGKMNPIPPL